MKLLPVNNHIIVRALEAKEATKSGIILPSGVEEDGDMQTSFAEVVATEKDSYYQIGMTVLFSKLIPDDLLIEDENGDKQTFWIVKETDVKAIVNTA